MGGISEYDTDKPVRTDKIGTTIHIICKLTKLAGAVSTDKPTSAVN